MDTYNGWTNYATWRINLEIFDGCTLEDMSWDDHTDAYELGQLVQEYADEIVFNGCENNLAESYARAFMSDVNWTEIAQGMIDQHKLDNPEEVEEDEEEESE